MDVRSYNIERPAGIRRAQKKLMARSKADKEKLLIKVEAEACPDHIHMLISIPPKYSVSQIMGYLRGKSSFMIFDLHAKLKYKYGNRYFRPRGYHVDTVGRNKKQVQESIKKQLQ